MKRYPIIRSVTAGLFLLFVIVVVGCSSEESSEVQDTSQAQTTYGRAVDKAEETATVLSNPKEGLDPVCGMAVDENSVIVTINNKDYALCSAKCGEDLKANPDKYLVAAADDHEGHDH